MDISIGMALGSSLFGPQTNSSQSQLSTVEFKRLLDCNDWHSILLSEEHFQMAFLLQNVKHLRITHTENELAVEEDIFYQNFKTDCEKLRNILMNAYTHGRSDFFFYEGVINCGYFENEQDVTYSTTEENQIDSDIIEKLPTVLDTLGIPYEKTPFKKQLLDSNIPDIPFRFSKHTIHWPALSEKQPQGGIRV